MRKLLWLLPVIAVFATAGVAHADGVIPWTGNGSDNLPWSDGGHWVLAPEFGIDSATLTVNGVDYVMTQNGNGSWSADSVGPIDDASTAYVTYTGAGDERDHLQLSHCEESSPSPSPSPSPSESPSPSQSPSPSGSTSTPPPSSSTSPPGSSIAATSTSPGSSSFSTSGSPVSPTAFTGGLPVLPIVVGLVLLTLGTL